VVWDRLRPWTRRRQPLFLFESISGLVGAAVLLWIARRFGPRLRPGDIALLFFIWYATTRFLLEPLRAESRSRRVAATNRSTG
jgi:prolipoprotein diacylglyceryltransferase